MVDLDVVGHITLGEMGCFDHQGELLGLVGELDGIAHLDAVTRDGHASAIDLDVAVIDKLPGGENCRNELGPKDDGVKPTFQQPNQVGAESPFIRMASS